MLFCLYRHPTATPDEARLGLVRDDDIVDLHLACLTSLAGHMKLRRAAEIARALVPANLLAFLEGGRHSWSAVEDSFMRLGRTVRVGLVAPTDDAVVVLKEEVSLVPLVPTGLNVSSPAVPQAPERGWQELPVRLGGAQEAVSLFTDGIAYLPELYVVVGSPDLVRRVDTALDGVAFVSVLRASRPESAALLHRPASVARDADVAASIAHAVADASDSANEAGHALLAGDVVRCGPARLVGHIDLPRDEASFGKVPSLT